MTETESELLGLILSAWTKLVLDDPAQRRGEGHYAWRDRVAAINELDRLGVVVDPCWLGSDPAGRQARSRAMAGLVADGWLIKTVVHRRLTYVLPTDYAITAILNATEDQPSVAQEAEPLTTEPQPSDVGLSLADLDRMLAIDPALDRMLADDAASLDELLASIATDLESPA